MGPAAGPVQGQVSTRRKGGWGRRAGPRAGQSVGPREASADPHCAPTTSPSLRKGNSGPTGLGVGKRGEGRALHKVGGGPFPQPVTPRRPKAPLRGRRPRVSGHYRPKRTRPTHWAPASPEDSGAAAPEDSWAAPAAAARREPGLSNPGPHLPRPGHGPATLPGDVEGQRGPQTEWLPSCLSGRELRAATWRRFRRPRRQLRGPRAWPRPLPPEVRRRGGARPACV